MTDLMVFGTSTLLIGLKHFQAIGDLMCAGLQTHIVYDELDISNIVEREKARWVEDFVFDTEHSSLQLYKLSTKPIIQSTSILTMCLLSDAIPTGD